MDLFFIEEKIHELLAAKFLEDTFQDCFLVELNLHKGNKLEVFIDCDNGLTLDKCQQISRYLEFFFDQENLLGDHYVLEVSSPGLNRPLKLKRQYLKNVGRKIEVTLIDSTAKTGILKTVTDDFITLEETHTIKEGKKKKTVVTQTELPFTQIKKTFVLITF